MGDMFCSLTYPFGNIELFFCLYVNNWTNMGQCASSSSRLLGFFSCLPGIWRALQCLRRYYDTRNIFPHLVNCGKYTFTILFYMSLSLYRIHKTTELRILFIAMATINATYCSKFLDPFNLTLAAYVHRCLGLGNGLVTPESVREKSVPTRRLGIQEYMDILCSNDSRPYPAFQLDFVRNFRR